MTKPTVIDGDKTPPDAAAAKALEGVAQNPGRPKRRPSKSRAAAWAKIDAGKGTSKPK